MSDNSPQIVEGACALCNTPVPLPLGERVDNVRWVLTEKVWCPHCKVYLRYALRDGYGRFWGRRKVWND